MGNDLVDTAAYGEGSCLCTSQESGAGPTRLVSGSLWRFIVSSPRSLVRWSIRIVNLGQPHTPSLLVWRRSKEGTTHRQAQQCATWPGYQALVVLGGPGSLLHSWGHVVLASWSQGESFGALPCGLERVRRYKEAEFSCVELLFLFETFTKSRLGVQTSSNETFQMWTYVRYCLPSSLRLGSKLLVWGLPALTDAVAPDLAVGELLTLARGGVDLLGAKSWSTLDSLPLLSVSLVW